jgi:hypothetical protein
MDAAQAVQDGAPLRRLVVHLSIAEDVNLGALECLLQPKRTPNLEHVELHATDVQTEEKGRVIRRCLQVCGRVKTAKLSINGRDINIPLVVILTCPATC